MMAMAGVMLVAGTMPADAYDPPKQGQVVARINGEIITDRQVSTHIKQFQMEYKMAIQELIDNKIIFQSAVREGVIVPQADVDDLIKERTAKIGTPDDFKKFILDPLKVSTDEYRKSVHEELMRKRYIQSKIGAPPKEKDIKTDFRIDIFVSPKEIKEYFAKHRADFTVPGKIKTRQIIIKYDRQNKDLKKAAADSLLKEAISGTDFAGLAAKNSDLKANTGGAWDWTEKGSFPKEVEDVIYNLSINAISPVIETSTSYLIIKVEDKVEPKNPSEDDLDVQQTIRQILSNQKILQGIETLKEKLRQESDIQLLR